MPKIFLIASAVLLLLSAGLSFANKNKLTAQIADAKQAHEQTAAAQSDASKAKTAQKTAEKAAAEAVTKASDLQGQLAASATQVTDLNTKLADATKSITEKDAAIADLTAKAATGKPAGPAVPDDATAKQIADLTRERDELKIVKDGLEGQVKAAQSQTASLSKQIAARQSGVAMNGLRGQVLAVDHNWNFVVLNLGDRQGVSNNATMIVQRGGSLVGRVKVTAVEPSQSVADIVPNSVPAGIEVRPGDSVVFQNLN